VKQHERLLKDNGLPQVLTKSGLAPHCWAQGESLFSCIVTDRSSMHLKPTCRFMNTSGSWFHWYFSGFFHYQNIQQSF